jgi:WD40 repeat protein
MGVSRTSAGGRAVWEEQVRKTETSPQIKVGRTSVVTALQGHSDFVSSVAFSPDSSRIASGSLDSTIRIWDSVTGNVVARLEGHRDQVRSVAFSPDGTRIVSASSDCTARIWDTTAGDLVHSLEGHKGMVTSVVFCPDSSLVVSSRRTMRRAPSTWICPAARWPKSQRTRSNLSLPRTLHRTLPANSLVVSRI